LISSGTTGDYRDLHEQVQQVFSGIKDKKYLFVDEIQEIESWEKAITSLFSEGDFDLYITGSNAHLLSSEISTLISGRYIEFPIYPLGFKEFLQFRNDQRGTPEEEFRLFLRLGGTTFAISRCWKMSPVLYLIISAISFQPRRSLIF
jgi:uncharacterized protein